MKKTVAVVMTLGMIFWLASMASADVVVYQEDFESDPNFTVPYYPSNLYWDSIQGNYYGETYVSSLGLRYMALSPTFDMVNVSYDFTIEFDFNPVQPAWGAHPSIYFFSSPYDEFVPQGDPGSPQMYFANHWSGYAPNYFRLTLYTGVDDVSYTTPTIPAANEWYHLMLKYYAASSTGDFVVERENGSIFQQHLGVFFLATAFDQFGVGEEVYRDEGSQAIFRVDNIQITGTPVPGPSLSITELIPPQGAYGTKIKVMGSGFGDQQSDMFNATKGFYSFVTFSDDTTTMTATECPSWSDTESEVLLWHVFIDTNGNYLQDGDEPFLYMNQLSPGAYAVTVNTIWFDDNNTNGVHDDGDVVTDTFSSNSEYFALTTDPIVTISMTPDTTIADLGGSLGFWASVTNNTDIAGTVLVGTRATGPGGGLTGYLIGPSPVHLEPRESKSKHLWQPVDVHVPTGNYTYRGYVGNYGSGIYDQDYFYFEVQNNPSNCSCHSGGGGGHHGTGRACTDCHSGGTPSCTDCH